MFKEFREFAMKGNVVDMAIGVIMGAAFGGIVNSMVNDVIMPPIGQVTGNVDFKDLFIAISGGSFATLADAKKANAPVIAYGVFLNTIINFLIVAFCMFFVVKQMNRLKHPEAPAETPKEQVLLGEIRDILKSRSAGV